MTLFDTGETSHRSYQLMATLDNINRLYGKQHSLCQRNYQQALAHAATVQITILHNQLAGAVDHYYLTS
jgi:hypothetical protein